MRSSRSHVFEKSAPCTFLLALHLSSGVRDKTEISSFPFIAERFPPARELSTLNASFQKSIATPPPRLRVLELPTVYEPVSFGKASRSLIAAPVSCVSDKTHTSAAPYVCGATWFSSSATYKHRRIGRPGWIRASKNRWESHGR